ncbi:MAG: DNA-directed RNA polymerase subunit alpha [Phycisphaerae bacterium]|nr:DNA-directed RNA polymerase subunit alpha [Phycisphaerae bacterium]
MTAQQVELEAFFSETDYTHAAFHEWADRVYASPRTIQQFRELTDTQHAKASTGSTSLATGLGLLLLGRLSEAIEMLASGTDNKIRRYFAGLANVGLGRYEEAIAEFERASNKGWDALQADMQAAGACLRAGNLPGAQKLLDRHARAGKDRAEWHFASGQMLESAGEHDRAIEALERAMELDPDDPQLMFRAAFLYDLHGLDAQAIELYERLSLHPAAYVNALINLAVLYEDRARYPDAMRCLVRVLATHPNHLRARLFLRDVESSAHMHVDDDRSKRIETQSKLLDTPITEFELSVRSRNCLKKMNIVTLGDLLRTGEAELLAYKNFGETSLAEIHALLATRGLRLGQGVPEAEVPRPAPVAPPVHVPPGAEGNLRKPVSEMELSVRARKCLQRLNIGTVGELILKTEAELLAIRNFGVTSLNEIKLRLADLGLQLAGASRT